MKLIIAGSRDFNDVQLTLKSFLEFSNEITSETGVVEYEV